MTTLVRRADLGPLTQIGQGGFSNVYSVPGYVLPGDPTAVAYKEFTADLAAQGRSAAAVVTFREMLSEAGRNEIDRYTAWPRALVEDDEGNVTGLLMPLIPAEFFADMEDPTTGSIGPHLREMQWLIASRQQRQEARIDLPDVELSERVTLLAQLAYILARLHEHGWVFGDLSFRNVVFTLRPLRIMLLDCDGAAALTDFQRRQASTPMWDPPECSFSGSYQGPAPVQSERQDTVTDVYKLGLAILRCLSPGRGAASSRSAVRVAEALDAEGAQLIARAVSVDRSSRPTAREIYSYLYGTVPPAQRSVLPQVQALRTWVRPLAGVRSDAPTADDLLGTAFDADTLAELIAATETSAPLAVALIGEWGSGKSSVMLQIQRRIDVLAEMSRNNRARSMFAANVRQVRFNAWDYSDDHVWVGITENLFRVLATDIGVSSSPAAPAEARSELIRLRALLAEREREEQRLAEVVQAADKASVPRGYLAGLTSPARAVRVMAAASTGFGRDVRSSLNILLGWIVLGAVAAAVWVLWGPLLGAVASAIAAMLSPAVAVGQRLRDWYRAGSGFIDSQRSRLDARQRSLRQEIAELRRKLAVADATAKLSTFLADRADDAAYRQHRGLLGQVRGDLAQLSADLASARRQWAAEGAVGQPPLERIVLYIDDLDRCPPRKVVEVLEAVHLMLALDLFVVVVAIDARWVIRSLEYYYRELFSHQTRSALDASESDIVDDLASPVDYLDKIFQIPFALTPPSPDALSAYVRSLLPLAPGLPAAGVSDAAGEEGSGASGLPGKEPGGRSADRTASRPGPAPEPDSPRAPSGPAVPDLHPLRLQLMLHEVEFMTLLSVILRTPRAAKKLTNLYRLVRIGIPDTQLAEFAGSASSGPYQVVQILLAMLVSSPDATRPIFRQIMGAPADGDILEVLAAVADAHPGRPECARLSGQVAVIAERTPMLGVREYQRWCPRLARFSFHTRPFTTMQADTAVPQASVPGDPAAQDQDNGSRRQAASDPMVMPFYLVCDVSGSEDDLDAVNEAVKLLRGSIVKEPVVDDVARVCVIAFSGTSRIVLPMGHASRPLAPLPVDQQQGDADYGKAFHLLAKTIEADIAHLTKANSLVYRPCAFFIAASAPRNRDYLDTFTQALTYRSETGEGLKDYPVFIPVSLRRASREAIRSLTGSLGRSISDYHGIAGAREAFTSSIDLIMKTVVGRPFPWGDADDFI